MIIAGELIAESPIYRGNAKKTLFTRDGDGTQRLVSLAGEVTGTAQSLMDAFVGRSRDGKNIGLINKMWERLFEATFPDNLITKIECELRKDYYPKKHFFDLRMGIKLDEDRWAIESQKNYKIETLYKNSVFDFMLNVNESIAGRNDNMEKLSYVLNELEAGRFWFGAGKSKGLGKCRLQLSSKLPASKKNLKLSSDANHLTINISIDAQNPHLVSWPWGKLDPHAPVSTNINGKFLISGLRSLPDAVSNRLIMSIGAPIMNIDDWKKEFSKNLPQAILFSLVNQADETINKYFLPKEAISKASKGKYPINKKILSKIKAYADKKYDNKDELINNLNDSLGADAKKAKRLMSSIECQEVVEKGVDSNNLELVSQLLNLNSEDVEKIKAASKDESKLLKIISDFAKNIVPQFNNDIDRQIKMLQSDPWIDIEIKNRKDHLQIKKMLLERKISERDWDDHSRAPKGIKENSWRSFKKEHTRVRYKFMTNSRNLNKSITNDTNYIEFLEHYRNQVRQELSQIENIDFRLGGKSNQEASKKYGKPYDSMFIRMLSFSASTDKKGMWEVFIPGSTIKGAFRKRASMLLNTLTKDKFRNQQIIDRLFGKQGRTGLLYFSDAYLMDSQDVKNKFCSLDGVRMNPATGRPVEEAKADFLFAYGSDFKFNMQIDLQDISSKDLEALNMFAYLLIDFNNGDIPIGSLKTSGFGWVISTLEQIEWLTTNEHGIHKKLFNDDNLKTSGIWKQLILKKTKANSFVESLLNNLSDERNPQQISSIPRAREGYISHRSFGGYCGHLFIEGKVLTPMSICESGEPTIQQVNDSTVIKGWDFFSFSPPEVNKRQKDKNYAVPAKTLKGMIRNIYTITSNSTKESPDISRLSPVDSLFGWVGTRQNEAIMGRLSFNFGTFKDQPNLVWHKVPYPYGSWHFEDNQWTNTKKESAQKEIIADKWRIFTHAPLAPCIETLKKDFKVDTAQANYINAIMPDSCFQFSIRFWNLEKEELERLIFCVQLEKNLAHKIGNHKYLGFGSVSLNILKSSHLINWNDRYSGKKDNKYKIPLKISEWKNDKILSHLSELKKVLYVK